MRSAASPAGATRVVLVVDVPSGMPELVTSTEELVNDFGKALGRAVPGLRPRRALVLAANESRAATPYQADVLTIDRANRDVWIDGQPVRLTYREFELLSHLALRAGRAVSRADLMRDVWRADVSKDGAAQISWRTIDTHIRRLRVKLGRYERILTTVRGQGYRFERRSDVHLVGEAEAARPA